MTPAALRALQEGSIENFVTATTPGGIEAQEKQGQLSMAGRPGKLPIKGTNTKEERERWEALGFVFGPPVHSGDDPQLWVEVVFPLGWTVVPTDHSMWSDILDAQGRKRAMMFYKAAFYDQKAHVQLERRYDTRRDYAGRGVGDAAGLRCPELLRPGRRQQALRGQAQGAVPRPP